MRDAAEQAKKLFQVALIQRRIDTEILVAPEIEANVPFHVAAFALANLIGNAKEAIRANGKITIEAEESGNSILCHVINSGPPISQQEQEGLFEFGKTSKKGHNGWGLYFVMKSLQENGCGINLDTASPETRFTIRLPKPGPE
jgi:sensor histidine kinase regulating citrate/malate metabolism